MRRGRAIAFGPFVARAALGRSIAAAAEGEAASSRQVRLPCDKSFARRSV